MAGTMVLPPLLKSCQNLQISPDVKSYLDHFEVSPETLQKVIAEAMSKYVQADVSQIMSPVDFFVKYLDMTKEEAIEIEKNALGLIVDTLEKEDDDEENNNG